MEWRMDWVSTVGINIHIDIKEPLRKGQALELSKVVHLIADEIATIPEKQFELSTLDYKSVFEKV